MENPPCTTQTDSQYHSPQLSLPCPNSLSHLSNCNFHNGEACWYNFEKVLMHVHKLVQRDMKQNYIIQDEHFSQYFALKTKSFS